MRTSPTLFAVFALWTSAVQAQDPSKSRPPLPDADTQGRYQLKLAPLERPLTSADGRLSLQSGFDAVPKSAPSTSRYALHSELQDKAAPLACGNSGDGIFANGFQ